MSIREIQPAALRPIIEALGSKLQETLGDQFVGFYIHGSIAMQAFTLDRSDIDYLVVTREEIDNAEFEQLKQMHAGIYESGLFGSKILEGSYISEQAIKKYDPNQCVHTALRCDGVLAQDGHDVDWVIQRYVLREKGIVVSGPSLKLLIDPVSASDMQQAAYGILDNWWRPQLVNHSNLVEDEYQAYAVLTMCRAFYTIQMVDVVPKAEAANWFCTEYPEWKGLVEKAFDWRKGLPFDALDATMDLIRFTLEKTESLLDE